ncbi:MAG: DUF975 family protein [Erysipelotrichaceae bacterium]|nr:DUF975 family protein [Erysipelotrichaceae bacterium]
MNTSLIRQRAAEFHNRYASELSRIFLIIGIISLIPAVFDMGDMNTNVVNVVQTGTVNRVFSFGGLVYVLLSILFIPLEQGYVVSTLKVITNRGNQLEDSDAIYGLTHYLDLVSTYILRFLYVAAFTIVPCIGLMFLAMLFASMGLAPVAGMIGIATAVLAVYLAIRNALLTALVGYVIEEDHVYNVRAITRSLELVNGHKWEFCKLILGYLGWIIGMAFVSAVAVSTLSLVFGALPGIMGQVLSAVFGRLVGVVLACYTYRPKMHLSYAIFYEELRYASGRR